MHVIATAGHVDHGKSKLVEALTGIDPDRLEEEKRRGLTIDLGFAWLALPSGREVGIVDVPGHERFIKNMLAGVGAINVTLFVVAANEGWKPQSQEHLDILDLLGVGSAVVAITKADTVEGETLVRVEQDVSRRIAGTSLARSHIIPVSAANGEGLDRLLEELDRLVSQTPPAEDFGRPRLWIDRVFSMRGSGTVVTGTLVGGGLRRHEEVEILPQQVRARIRGMQSHRKSVEALPPGNRCALNLGGIEPEEVHRGDTAVLPGSWKPSRRLIASIRFLPHLDHEITERGAFKFYVGSAEREAEIRFVPGSPKPGESAFATIALDQDLAVDWRDRFVLRDAGRRETLGGGLVLEPHPARDSRSRTEMMAERRVSAGGREEYATLLVEEEGVLSKRELSIRAGIDPESLSPAAIVLSSLIVSAGRMAEMEAAITAALAEHHRKHPLEPGMGREEVRSLLGLDQRAFDEITGELLRRRAIASTGVALHQPGHAPAPPSEERDALILQLQSAGSSPPLLKELENRHDPALIRALVRSGDLVQVSAEIVYSAAWIEEMKHKVRDQIETHGPLTVAAFRDLIGTTRKYAVPLAEYLDQIAFTRRQGDLRVLGPKSSGAAV